ncbi:MAG: polysaccharide export protein [Gammaproteobacteria bacterium]|nr:polysaccharide export protein [Gammaproteobacteria bacterium]
MPYSRFAPALIVLSLLLHGCAGTGSAPATPAAAAPVLSDRYVIGPGDSLQIFVWQHPEVSTQVAVRPDGRISTPLVEDMVAVGKTPTELSRDLEGSLAQYIRTPTVNVIVTSFLGTFGSQVRVVGQAALPQALPYRQDMTVLDVMIAVGGLTPNAAGNRAKIVRRENDQTVEIKVKLNDLLNKGRIDANVAMRPGDVLIIPESLL